MATIRIQDEITPGGMLATKDATLACLLGTLGFSGRAVQHIECSVNGQRLLASDRQEGRVDDLTEERFIFSTDDVTHPHWGRLNIFDISRLHRFCKLNQKHGLGQLSPTEATQYADLSKAVTAAMTPEPLFYHVQGLYDHLTNWNTYCSTVQELRKNPFITFSEILSNGKIAHVANPLELEDATARRAERFLRGQSPQQTPVRGHRFSR